MADQRPAPTGIPSIKALKPETNMLGPALIGGAATLLGGFLTNKGIKAQNKAQAFQAQKQMDFQERMSSTAHQREIKDLRLAGLNPILSGTGGKGASTPGGAQASIMDELGPAVASAQQIARVGQEIQLLTAQRKNLKAQTDATIWKSEPDHIRYKILTGAQDILKDLTTGGINPRFGSKTGPSTSSEGYRQFKKQFDAIPRRS